LLLGVSAPAYAQSVSFAGAQTTVPASGLNFPGGVAVDATGDVFIADHYNSRVVEVPAGGGAQTTVGSGLSYPVGVAVDGAGDVFIADTVNNRVVEVPAGGGAQTTVPASGLSYPYGVAVDGAGDVFIADSGNNRVVEVPAGGGPQITVGSGLSSPAGVAVDGAGDVFIADTGNSRVVEVPAGGGAQTTVGSGLGGPTGVALDAAGDVFIADYGNNRVVEVPTGGGAQTTVGTGLSYAYGVAVDGAGDLFIADTNNNRVVEVQRVAVNFGSVNICPGGQTTPAPCSQTITLNYSVNDDTTFGANPTVVTQGALNLDFTLSSGSTCTGTITAGNSCTVNVQFAPLAPGVRMGAVQLTDSSGNLLVTTFVHGTGQGPELVFPSNQSIQALGGGFSAPTGVAVDASGNIYVADLGNNAVKEMPYDCASSSCTTTLGGGFSFPNGVAVDGVGNVYVADKANSAVKEMSSNCSSTSCVTTLGGGFGSYSPQGVAVDGAGNVYVADTNNQAVKQMPPGCASSSCVTTLGGGFKVPTGVAVDASGNIYVADLGNNAVKEMPSGCASSSCVTTLGGGFNYPAPNGVAVDGGGNVYVVAPDSNAAYEMSPGCTSTSCVTTLGGGFYFPIGVAVDGVGNVYVADTFNNAVKELDLSSPPSLSFANTNVGSQSSDSPQTVTLRNIGNASLTFPVPGTGQDPSTSANFTLDSSTTCPEVQTSSSPGTLAAGATCTLALDFIPTTAGSITGTAVLTDNNLNVSSAMQTINLSGTGLNSTVSVSIGTNPAGLSFSINGTPYSATQTPSLSIGTQYTLSTTSPQAGGLGVQYVFLQWSDGTTSLTDLLTPTAATSGDTAAFIPQYLLTVTAGTGGTIGASTSPNGFYNPGTVQVIAATPNSGYYFTGWTGANSPGDIASATSAATTVTMDGPENLTANFAPIPSFQVTTLNDDATGNAANCTTPSPNCSLRDAITAIEANNATTGNITFASDLNGTITLTSALPTLNGQMKITGPGASNLTFSGANSQTVGSVFTVNSDATVAFSGITITGGNSVNGGGITNNGTATVTNSAISGNTGGCGGAICNYGTLKLSGSTLSGNTASFNGGGIVNAGTLTVINSTIANNTAHYDYGGGIFNNGGVLTVLNSTLSGNFSGQYGGGIYSAGTVTVSNSIVAGNTASGNPGDDCASCGTQSGYNFISTPNNIINPTLGLLSNYGGPTQTMIPLPGSAAICAGSPALIPAGVTTDQRGFPNTTTYNSTTCYDLGAVQTNYALNFNATQEPPSTGTVPGTAMSPAPAVTVTESGNVLRGGTASVSVSDANLDLTTNPATALTSTSDGQATFSSLIFTGATSNDTLTATLALNSNLTTLNLTTLSTSFSVEPATPTVTWPAASAITYGQTLTSSTLSGGSASFGNTSVPGSFAFTNPSIVPSAGTQTESVTFTPSNQSAYNSVSGTVSVLVNKATPTVSFTGAPAKAPYEGTFTVTATTNASTTAAITASGSCSISGTTVTISAPSGTCSLSASWAADNNYLAASATQSTTATKATPTITWPAPAAITYGTKLSATQLDATATYNGAAVAGKFAYSPATGAVLTAGSQTLSVSFTPTNTTDYNSASASVTLQVNPATPKITWAKPAAITYGTALSSTQLDATASVAGAFAYSPAAGTVLGGGTQTLSVTFTPANTTDYTTATDSVTITVNKATSTTVINSSTPNPSLLGQAVTVNFSVTGTGVPTGTVTVKASTGQTCSGTLSAGTGSCSLTFTASGSPTLTASYGGDSNFNSSTSTKVTQQVTRFTTSASPASKSIAPGSSATYTITLTPVNGFTGTVGLSCSGEPSGGTCTISPTSLTLDGSALTATATVTTTTSTTAGTYTLTFTGTFSSGTASLTESVGVTLKVS
jgi:CSLREA domain-containing protein/uncharacterized repeat protein (TIGR02543 family)